METGRKSSYQHPTAPKSRGLCGADDFVRLVAKETNAGGRRNGDADDDAGGASMACPTDGGDHGRPRRQPVVDEEDSPAIEVERRTVAMQNRVESLCLCQGGLDRAVQLIIGESVVRADVDAVPARGHTTESILRLARVTNFAHREGVEWE